MRLYLVLLCALPVVGLEIDGDLPVALVNHPYAADPLRILGGERCSSNSVQFQVVIGELPEGMRLSSGGYLSGTPRRTGTYQFLVHASNNCGSTTRAFTLRVDGAPIVLLNPGSLEFVYVAGGALAPAQTILVTSTWRDMPYSIEAEGAAWIELRPLRGRTPTEDSGLQGDPVSVSIDPGKLAPGTYRAYVKATAWMTSNEPAIPVTLVVKADSQR